MAIIGTDGRFMGWINREEAHDTIEGAQGRISFVESFNWKNGGGWCRRGDVVFT